MYTLPGAARLRSADGPEGRALGVALNPASEFRWSAMGLLSSSMASAVHVSANVRALGAAGTCREGVLHGLGRLVPGLLAHQCASVDAMRAQL